jgi:hypothetical protein
LPFQLGHFRKYYRIRSVEDAVGRVTGDKIAGATGADVKLRAERKLGGRAEALTPRRLRSVFISFGGPLRAMEHSLPVAARYAAFSGPVESRSHRGREVYPGHPRHLEVRDEKLYFTLELP